MIDEKDNQKSNTNENQEIKQLLQRLNDKVESMDHKVGSMGYKVDKLEDEVVHIKKKLIA